MFPPRDEGQGQSQDQSLSEDKSESDEEPIINNKLSSVSVSASAPPSTSADAVIIVSSSEEDTDNDLMAVNELEELQRSVSGKLSKYKERLERRKKVRKSKAKEVTKEQEQVPTLPGALELEKQRNLELKRKLEMVTEQMSQGRLELSKKLKRASFREQRMVVEVLDFPKEYYDVAGSIRYRGKLNDWYPRFNNHSKVSNRPEYQNWIQTRVNDFFPEVLKIMWKHLEERTKPVPRSEQIRGSDLLTCRLVSKSWRDLIDKFLQSTSLEERTSSVINSNFQMTTQVFTNCNKNMEKVVRLLTFFKENSSSIHNPFPSRDLVIRDCPLQKFRLEELLVDPITWCLCTYGQHLHSFSYYGTEGSREFEYRNARLTLHLLKRLPNLKSLLLSFPYSVDGDTHYSSNPAEPKSPSFLPAVKFYSQFPVIPSLIRLECRRVQRYLIHAILESNPLIENLTVLPFTDGELFWRSYKGLNRFSQLTQHVSTIGQIWALENVNWPLKKISLSSTGVQEELIDLGAVFKVLQHFSATLTDVSLELLVSARENENLSLKLPLLQNLCLHLKENLVGGNISYDFLLPLTSLQSLRITLKSEDEDKSAEEIAGGNMVQVIMLKGYLNRLYDSNIWSIFPALKTVDASVCYCCGSSSREFKYLRRN